MVGGSSHLDEAGRLRMVDVSGKAPTPRRAVARCQVVMRPETLEAVVGGAVPKGDVLAVAQVAGVLAAKRTPELIPGCHPVRLTAVEVGFEPGPQGRLGVRAEARGEDRTGFEMEALVACAVAALTVYDMCKGLDPELRVTDLEVVAKEGGKSGPAGPEAVRPLLGVRAVVVTVSDSAARGEREDRSGPAARAWLEQRGAEVAEVLVVPDDRGTVTRTLRQAVDRHHPDLVLTTGGTGVGPADVTPEATLDAADRLVPGLAEAMRARSLAVTPHAMLSRGVAAVVGRALVVNLPGSPKAVVENLDAVEPALAHAVELLRGERPH